MRFVVVLVLLARATARRPGHCDLNIVSSVRGAVVANGVAVVPALLSLREGLAAAANRSAASPSAPPLQPVNLSRCERATDHVPLPQPWSIGSSSDGDCQDAPKRSLSRRGESLHLNSDSQAFTFTADAGGAQQSASVRFDGLDVLCALGHLHAAADALQGAPTPTPTPTPTVGQDILMHASTASTASTTAASSAPTTASSCTGPARRPTFIGRRGVNLVLNTSTIMMNGVDVVQSLRELRDKVVLVTMALGIVGIDVAIEVPGGLGDTPPALSDVRCPPPTPGPPPAPPTSTAPSSPDHAPLIDVIVSDNFTSPAWTGYASGPTVSGHLQITDNGAEPHRANSDNAPRRRLEDMLQPAFVRLANVGGRLQIRNNSALTRLGHTEFGDLAHVGNSEAAEYGRGERCFEIRWNSQLTTLDGAFPALVDVGGHFNIYLNDVLTTLGQVRNPPPPKTSTFDIGAGRFTAPSDAPFHTRRGARPALYPVSMLIGCGLVRAIRRHDPM